MAPHSSTRLRIAAIDFLNPAPLMWDFEHSPHATALAERYAIHSTTPARCADELLSGRADLGLIPIASLTPELAIVPGCTIASLDRVRSIQLIIKLSSLGAPFIGRRQPCDEWEQSAIDSILRTVRTVAADTASRSSVLYTQLLFRKFLDTDPDFLPIAADPYTMLAQADAALLIGDPALLALEDRARIEATVGPCLWLDLAQQWHARTGLPWVAAVWAARPEALAAASLAPADLITDLTNSRDHGLAHIDALVNEWSPRIAIPPPTIRHYLARNIHYTLNNDCITAIHHMRTLAAKLSLLPALPNLRFLD